MKRLIAIILILHAGTLFGGWPFQQKSMLGRQVDKSHQLGDFIGFWLMNERAGNKVFDLSGNGNTGTISGNVTWKPGKYGVSLDFNSDPDKLEIANPGITGGLSQLSVVFWLNSDSVAGNNTEFIQQYEDPYTFRFLWSSSEILSYAVNTSVVASGATSGAVLTDQKWHQVVGVYDGAKVYIYVDTVVGGTVGSLTGTTTVNTKKIKIGYSKFYGDPDARYSQVYIYDRALSASEIALLYREPFCFMADDLPVSMMYDYGAAAPSGQVIFIQMSAIPLFLIPMIVFLMRGKNVK